MPSSAASAISSGLRGTCGLTERGVGPFTANSMITGGGTGPAWPGAATGAPPLRPRSALGQPDAVQPDPLAAQAGRRAVEGVVDGDGGAVAVAHVRLPPAPPH